MVKNVASYLRYTLHQVWTFTTAKDNNILSEVQSASTLDFHYSKRYGIIFEIIGMHLHWEQSHNTAGDCNIRSLSWMGRVPDEIPQEEGWKLNRNHYYQEGWLSTANLRGVVGVTYTTSHCGIDGSTQLVPPSRTNYNLRGHRAEVTLVRWNEPYQKLASCDTSGIIFVWIKYEGRWSIELINDRSTPVICFSWSHDGRMALICYQDGFVLVGSVAGQRYWSTLLPPDINNITSGIWTPDDQHVYLGTSQGDILVMDIHGATVGKANLRPGIAITEMAWNCERFNMEEQPETQNNLNIFPSASNPQPRQPQPYLRPDGRPFVMAACLKNGDILLLRSYDDVIPQVLQTGFQSYFVDWTNSGELLAVAGKVKEVAVKSNHTIRYINVLHFYNDAGLLVYRVRIPCETFPVSSVTWGHNDKRLFVATGNEIHIGWVSSSIASLQLLSRLKIHNSLKNSDQVQLLPLPCRLQNLIGMLFTQTIRCCIPDPENLRNFVIKPQLPENVRLHCTMIRHSEKSLIENRAVATTVGAHSTLSNASGANSDVNSNPLSDSGSAAISGSNSASAATATTSTSAASTIQSTVSNNTNTTSAYTLYLEHLGGFLPILKGKRVSKIRPEFIIYDPQLPVDSESGRCSWHHVPNLNFHLKRLNNGLQENSEAETTDDETASPRGRRRRNRRYRGTAAGRYGFVSHEPPDYMNILPEDKRLAEVSSNIWGTKFKIVGVSLSFLPQNLGHINYKASLLHLQPRQMTLEIIDLKEEANDTIDDCENDDIASWLDIDSEQQSEDYDSESRLHSRQGCNSRRSGTFISDDEEDGDKAVTMKDDILTAVADFGDNGPPAPQNVAPVAPLPSSDFPSQKLINSSLKEVDVDLEATEITKEMTNEKVVISPTKKLLNCNGGGGESGSGCSLSTMVAVKRSPTVAPSVVPRLVAKSAVATMTLSASTASEVVEADPIAQESPSKRKLRMSVSCDNYLGDGKFSLSRRDSVGSGSPHSSKGSPLRWATKADEIGMTSSVTSACSPLRDEATQQPQPHSQHPQGGSQQNQQHHTSITEQRSCSANQLDVIVDILGVPSELLSQRDSNKRLFLLKASDKKETVLRRNRPPRRSGTCKLQTNAASSVATAGSSSGRRERAPPLQSGNKSKSCEDQDPQDLLMEVKRRSIYAKDCRGRTEAQACNKCQVVAHEVKDMELNREIFDIDDATEDIGQDDPEADSNSDIVIPSQQNSSKKEEEEEIIQVVDCPIEESGGCCEATTTTKAASSTEAAEAEDAEAATTATSTNNPAVKSGSSNKSRRFDSVRGLLEKVRHKLMTTKQSWRRSLSRSRAQSQDRPADGASAEVSKKEMKQKTDLPPSTMPSDLGSQSQSSPNTPAQLRKEKRHRSFSPVRTFFNSPLIRRKKKTSIDSSTSKSSTTSHKTENEAPKIITDSESDDDENVVDPGSKSKDNGFTNLESFQKKMLKQKLKKLNNPSNMNTTGPYPSPPPAPQRVPHPPRKNLQHAAGLLQPSTPLLPRRALNKGLLGGHPGATPTSTPNPTPNQKRRGLNALLQQYSQQQNQVHVTDAEKKESMLLNKKRRKLILHNKAPMWNEASQVYQLDFGGRVTQESAKNFQIECKGKQVMQFGRIDHNAYTLDFQYPFSAVQAFAVALANVTQRLK